MAKLCSVYKFNKRGHFFKYVLSVLKFMITWNEYLRLLNKCVLIKIWWDDWITIKFNGIKVLFWYKKKKVLLCFFNIHTGIIIYNKVITNKWWSKITWQRFLKMRRKINNKRKNQRNINNEKERLGKPMWSAKSCYIKSLK